MSTRRHLVSRSRNNETASPAVRRNRESEASSSQTIALPPYEPPSCPLSVAAKQKLEQLRASTDHDHEKYIKHTKASADAVANAAADANERLARRKDKVEKARQRRRERNIGEENRTEEDIEAESYAKELEKRVVGLTATAEKAMRDLLDYGDEMSMQKEFLREVLEKSTIANREAPADDPEIISPWEILQSAKEKYSSEYSKRSMREKYADRNEYKSFKRVIHDAQYSGLDNIPPLAHSKTWFPEENSRRRTNQTDNTENGDDDDDIVISGVKDTLKCPITLQYINEPLSSKACNHSFERSAIMALYEQSATSFMRPGSRVPDGPPRLQCPVSGCEKWHTRDDFYYDQAIKRRVIQAKKREKRQADGEDDDDEGDVNAPRGTQAGRPEEIDEDDDDDDGIEIDDADERRREIAKIKRERAQSRGLSVVPSQESPDEDDSMDID